MLIHQRFQLVSDISIGPVQILVVTFIHCGRNRAPDFSAELDDLALNFLGGIFRFSQRCPGRFERAFHAPQCKCQIEQYVGQCAIHQGASLIHTFGRRLQPFRPLRNLGLEPGAQRFHFLLR